MGFNNINYDYHLLHLILITGHCTADILYRKTKSIIEATDDDPWANYIKPSDRLVPQIDLYKINHFDNKARATSLKSLEIVMRSESVEDLPFPVGSILTNEQIDVLKSYNIWDTLQTREFANHNIKNIEFRKELEQKYPGRDWLNFADTKIGKEYFILKLEESGIPCYNFGSSGRQPRQTLRTEIVLNDAILPIISFQNPEFQRVLDYLRSQVIIETKGIFAGLSAAIKGFQFDFGTGGIHGSLSNKIVRVDDRQEIVDIDVASYYPNLAIANDFYPEHFGKGFCKIYKDLYEHRKSYKKGSAENAMLKLALNGVYGESNSPFSVFYDPLYTMKITLNGQLLLCKLVEMVWSKLPNAQLLQINTDGMTFKIDKTEREILNSVVKEWEQMTNLNMEFAEYSSMFIRDVNNYIAVKTNGDIKRKGVYEWQTVKEGGTLGWHQDHSALVVPKVAQKVLIEGVSIYETVKNWPEIMDFMIRAKVPRSSKLIIELIGQEYKPQKNYQWVTESEALNGQDYKLQNVNRVYVAKGGGELFKIMPPSKPKPYVWRKIALLSGWGVQVCNNLNTLKNNPLPVDYEYYIHEVEKLVLGLEG